MEKRKDLKYIRDMKEKGMTYGEVRKIEKGRKMERGRPFSR